MTMEENRELVEVNPYQRLLQGVLDPIEDKPVLETADKDKVRLELIKSSNPLTLNIARNITSQIEEQ